MTIRELERITRSYISNISIEIIQLKDGELLFHGPFIDLAGSLWYEEVKYIILKGILLNDYVVLEIYI